MADLQIRNSSGGEIASENDNEHGGLLRMPSQVESYLIALAQRTFGYHYLKPDAKTLRQTLKPGQRITARFNRRGTEFLGVAKGTVTINGVHVAEGEVIRIDTGEIIEITSEYESEIVSHIIPYRNALAHLPYAQSVRPEVLKMGQNKKVSIIVIAKDIENHICHALISCLNQTYPNIEVVVVDDGSKDGTASRIESMAKFDSRIHLHNVDLGANGARRVGLEHATGDYFLIIDGDDWLNDDAVEYVLMTALNLKSDLVQFGYDLYNDLNRHFWGWTYPSPEPEVEVLMPKPTKDEDAKELADLNHTIWMNFFSANVRNAALKAMCNLTLYEDLPFSLSLMQHAKNPAFCNLTLYHYRRERGGQTTQTWHDVSAGHKQACLKASVDHTLAQFDKNQDFYQLVLLYKIDQIISHELGISHGIEAQSWRNLMTELFAKFPAKLYSRLIGGGIKQHFRKAHPGEQA
ncbi:glycosyltransferase [Sphingobium baderi]|uniref:Uncharacterized protein n=1 Tax=Sphingobium baderi TaxID=1332080 RepID=A0A0S3F390_9SPHN|nr:glycosyltransferase [Sphingobium baderi]ALR22170.1 hypothetical protein ATN00_19485 [Sphingobium baderi]